ncbi:Dynactin subunit p27/WS-3, involved in transport of organelles along microtubules [Phaffia rhodozyma]|uniref:Dynactin subunit 6 n=1 Tax=Phaffia rhodozyma TaxID=264483 RepID=A0A0F7SQT4_PHARH|nr:Dynactin subunit p27/WS-3, involved in transport of organelles along microtubules [Phaffia rhodozyma]
MARLLKDNFEISHTAIVCHDVELKGEIIIGSGTIIHSKATIFAITGPIVIGSDNIIEEGAVIVNRRKETMQIGDHNLFSINSRIESPSVGSFNTFHPRSSTAASTRITDNCIIGAGCALVPSASDTRNSEEEQDENRDEVLEPYTVIYLLGDEDGGRRVGRRISNRDEEDGDRDLRVKHAQYLREV